PTAVMEAMITSAISDARRAYSIAVAPSSAAANLFIDWSMAIVPYPSNYREIKASAISAGLSRSSGIGPFGEDFRACTEPLWAGLIPAIHAEPPDVIKKGSHRPAA